MKPKLLIVDDEQNVIDRFRGYLQGESVEIAAAQSLEQAIQIAERFRPAAATIDFSIADHTGNEVAAALRAMYSDIRMAGITGGNPQDFNPALFEIRAHKSIEAGQYVGIVRQLLGAPGEQTYEKPVPAAEQETMVAVYVLLQGYNIARKLQRGEPIEELEKAGVKLPVPSEEQARGLLDFQKMGIDAKQLYNQLCSADQSAKYSISAGRLFTKIAEGKMKDVLDEEAEEAEMIIKNVLGGM